MEHEIYSRTDRELVHDTRTGSLSAFDELLHRHGDRIYNFLVGRTGNTEDAQDLAQTVFIKAYNNLDKYDAKYMFTTWIFCIARREFASFYRKRRPHSVEMGASDMIDARDPSLIMAEGEGRSDIWNRARAVLSERQFSALWMHYREDFSIKETAKIMGCRSGSVKVLLHRARTKLLESMSGNDSCSMRSGHK